MFCENPFKCIPMWNQLFAFNWWHKTLTVVKIGSNLWAFGWTLVWPQSPRLPPMGRKLKLVNLDPDQFSSLPSPSKSLKSFVSNYIRSIQCFLLMLPPFLKSTKNDWFPHASRGSGVKKCWRAPVWGTSQQGAYCLSFSFFLLFFLEHFLSHPD